MHPRQWGVQFRSVQMLTYKTFYSLRSVLQKREEYFFIVDTHDKWKAKNTNGKTKKLDILVHWTLLRKLTLG
jgi:hypothetical protein